MRHLLRAAVVSLALLGAGGSEAAGGRPVELAYANDAKGSLDVYVVREGGRAARLTSSPRDEFSPTLSPDTTRIAYRVNPPKDDVGDIWLMRADGTGKRNLTRSPRVADWSPAWSPDGRWIAYFSTAGGGGDVWLMRPDGSRRRNLTRDGSLNEYPAWAPDGRTLGFQSHRDGQFEIYRMRSDGAGQRRLTDHPAKDQWPAWSPDGRLIAFMSERDGSEDVFVMRSDGSGVRNLTRTPALQESHPAWRANGRLTFTRHAESGPIEVWECRPDGSRFRRLPLDVEPVFSFTWALRR